MKSYKKKILVGIILVVALCLLTGCVGNRSILIDTHQTFNQALIRMGDAWECVDVQSWRDFEDGDEVQVVTPTGAVYLTHYSNMVLIKTGGR